MIVFPYDFRQALINSLLGIIICLSLVVIIGFVGQISVVQLALAGVAGFTMSHLTTDVGGIWAKFPISLLIGASVATIVGLVIAVSALRVRGVSLAVVTLAAAVALEQFGFLNSRWGGGPRGSPVEQPSDRRSRTWRPTPRSGAWTADLPSPIFGFLVLAATVLLALLVANVRRSSLGQRMLAVRSNERAAAAAGINVRNTKLAGFGIAAFIAGMAGALYAYNFGSVSYEPLRRGRRTRADRVRLLRRDHDGLRRRDRRGRRDRGSLPARVRPWFGLNGTWALLVGGFALIITLIVNPEGIAGTGYKKQQQKKKRQAAAGRSPARRFVPRLSRAGGKEAP